MTRSFTPGPCGQSFHWFATEAALREIHRVLRPSGRLALVWNALLDSHALRIAISSILAPYEGDTPRYGSGHWREVLTGAAGQSLFGDLEHTQLHFEVAGSAQQLVVARYLSTSFIAALDATERSGVERALRDLLAREPETRAGEQIRLPYRTDAYCLRRR